MRTPVLYVYGARDAQLGRRALERFRLVPGVELQEVAEAGHACYAERPTQWLQLLANFLDRIGQSSAQSPY